MQRQETSHGQKMNQMVIRVEQLTQIAQLCMEITVEITDCLMTWCAKNKDTFLATYAKGMCPVNAKIVGSFQNA